MAPAPVLQPRVRLHVRGDEGRRADGGEVLRVLLVVPQLLARHAHDLDADAAEADVVDVRLDMRPGPGEAHPAAIGRRRREQPVAQVLGQAVVDRELAAHEPVRLGVAGPLEAAAGKIAHEMPAHLVDHRLRTLLLAELRRLLGEADVLPAAPDVLEPGRQRAAIGMRKTASNAGRRNGCSMRRSRCRKISRRRCKQPEEHRRSPGRRRVGAACEIRLGRGRPSRDRRTQRQRLSTLRTIRPRTVKTFRTGPPPSHCARVGKGARMPTEGSGAGRLERNMRRPSPGSANSTGEAGHALDRRGRAGARVARIGPGHGFSSCAARRRAARRGAARRPRRDDFPAGERRLLPRHGQRRRS